MEFLTYIATGALVGFAIGLTGVGGGSLMTPLLLLFGFSPQVAIGTDLLYAALTKIGGAISHHRKGNVNWKIVKRLALGSIPISILLHLLFLNWDFHADENSTTLLTRSLGIMLIVTSTILIFRDKLRLAAVRTNPSPIMGSIHRNAGITTVLMGMVLGLCVTLSSVGAGAFGAAVLMVIYANLPAVRIVGSDVAHAVPLTFIAGLGYLLNGYVDLMLLLSLLLGSLPAIHLGSHVSSRVSERLLQRLLTLILLCLGIRYLLF